MKKVWILTVLVLVSLVGWIVVPAEPLCAAPSCAPGGTTSWTWGMGASCEEARNNAQSLLLSWVPTDCEVCETTFTSPGDCELNYQDNLYHWTFRLRYSCEQTFIDPPM